MGWSSGSTIFDKVAALILDSELSEERQAEIISALIDVLEDYDWDTQGESDYYEHPIFQKVMKEKHDWFGEDDEDLDEGNEDDN